MHTTVQIPSKLRGPSSIIQQLPDHLERTEKSSSPEDLTVKVMQDRLMGLFSDGIKKFLKQMHWFSRWKVFWEFMSHFQLKPDTWSPKQGHTKKALLRWNDLIDTYAAAMLLPPAILDSKTHSQVSCSCRSALEFPGPMHSKWLDLTWFTRHFRQTRPAMSKTTSPAAKITNVQSVTVRQEHLRP